MPAALARLMLEGMASLFAKLRPKRRWMQVSLRAVLVLVTLLCVALSLWVVPVKRQRRAVAAIQELDGSVSYVETDPANEMFPVAFLRRWLPPDYFDAIGYVDLSGSNVTDAGLAHLQGLAGLQELHLGTTQITDAGVAHLQRLTSLQWLDLDNTQVTDAGLARVRGLTGLQVLSLRSTQVTDAGLAHLQGLASLQFLDLENTQVTDAGLPGLRKALPECEICGLGL